MTRMIPSVVALLLAVAASALLIAVSGGDPVVSLGALAAGAFGNLAALSEVGVKTCPLLLAGMAVAIAFRAGVWNIGAEGQLLAGAAVMAWIGQDPVRLPTWAATTLALAAAAGGGALWAGLAGVLKVQRGVNEVIGTIMLNFIALGLTGYLVHGPLMEAAGRYPQTDAVALAIRLPRLATSYRVHAGLFIAAGAVVAAGLLLFRTALGFELRAVGANPTAARLAGIPVDRRTLLALTLSGALAGLAGGIEISAVTFRLYERFSPGYGFTAIAVALLGRLHPVGVTLAACLFGALEAGSASMQRVAGTPASLVSVIQATVIFSLLAVHGLAGIRTERATPSESR